MEPALLREAVDIATRRNASRAASLAVLQGRIVQPTAQSAKHGRPDSEQLQKQIAGVLRAGLRRGDSLSQIDADGFTIILPGADERSAARIANRLRRLLARFGSQQGGSATGVSASFGVAAGAHGEPGDRLIRQARRALDTALTQGRRKGLGQRLGAVVTASEFAEVLYLPAPNAAPAKAAA